MLMINLAVGSHVRVHIISVFWSSGKLFSALACPYSFFFFSAMNWGGNSVCWEQWWQGEHRLLLHTWENANSCF